MNTPRPFPLEPNRPAPRWGLLALAALILFGAAAYALLHKASEVTLTAREDTASEERAFIVEVRARPPAFRLDLPRLGVRAMLRDGRGEFWIRAEELSGNEGPLKYVLREPWYRSDRKGTVEIAGLPSPLAETPPAEAPPEETPAARTEPSANTRPAPSTALEPIEHPLAPPGAASATGEQNDTPQATSPAAPIPTRSAWARDRALESELAGRGVTGVTILRKGRSIRLRGTVGSDKTLRAVYQFMNDKGFGEVSYGVEVR